jgi:hypothetical protein
MEHVAARPLALGGIRRGTPALAAWALGFAPVALLAFQGGGYDTVVRSQAGIAVWWIIALGVLAGALRPAMPSRRALVAVGLLTALGVWTWIGVASSESSERTLAEAARIATYLGVFVLGLMAIDRRHASTVVVGVASAIGLVATLAVLSRLQPEIFPANETGQFLEIARSRLNWPLNYWNGLAALCALGLPLLLALAAGHARVLVRGAAAALVPILALCIDLTISRGGIAATVVGIVTLLALAPNRLRLLGTMALTGTASAILIAAAAQRGLVHKDLAASGLAQGDQLTVVMGVVAAGAALMQTGAALLERLREPRAARLTRRQTTGAFAAVAVAAIVIAVAAGAPNKLSNAWQEFKSPAAERAITGNYDPSRLASLSSNGRFELWSLALDSLRAEPIEGTGAGTYEFTWLRETSIGGKVLDAHSYYLELGSETGVVGLVLGTGFMLALMSIGASILRLPAPARLLLAGSLASVTAFAFSAAVDWVWEVPVIPIAVVLIGAAAFASGRTGDPAKARASASIKRRIGTGLAALVPIGLLTIVLASTSSVQESRTSARAGSLSRALSHAIDAHAVAPAAATPLLQSALIREWGGDLRGAAADARQAARREPSNWRAWLVLSRVEARAGRAQAAIAAFRRTRALNPHYTLFRR